ncbi:T9SS type A sorting domain-containing protein [Hoylesella buccalis]|nr:T9SS type A sorting domain-containing protein [Hoylesella buccalis]
MKHLLPTRYLLTMLLACFMALGVQAQAEDEVPPLELFVSAKTGNDFRNGSSWNDAYKTLKQALNTAENNANTQVKIYLAEGEYDVSETDAIKYSDGQKRRKGFYVLSKKGQKLWLMGGYPTPGSQTLPHDICNSNPQRHVTKFVSKDVIKTSVFRTNNHNQGLIMHGITFDSKNFVGGSGDGALITFDNNGYDNPYLEMIDCSIKYYKSSMCGAIYFFGTMKNPKIKIERVEVLQGERVGATGGGFLVFNELNTYKPTNIQIDMKYVTFHDINHLGPDQKYAVIGAQNYKPSDGEDNSYVNLDHVQVNRNLGGMAGQQITTISLQSFKKVSVTNSIFRNTTSGIGGAFRVQSCHEVVFKNNQFHNCKSGDAGGAVSVQRGGSTYIPAGTGRRTITFINNEFENNIATNAGGALQIQDEDASAPVDVTIDNCNFKGNKSKGQGGALYIANQDGNVKVTNTVFCNNSGSKYGGAFRIANNAKSLLVEGCYFGDNSCDAQANALSIGIQKGKFDVKNCVFYHNHTTSSVGADSGGAVNVESGYGDFTNCKFVGNTTSKSGGAVALNAPTAYVVKGQKFNFVNCLFENNTAAVGGAIAQLSIVYDVIIKNSIFKGNKALSWDGGGAISVADSKGLEVSNSIFSGNTTDGMGGAIFTKNDAYLKSSNNKYYGNQAVEGGAIRIMDNTGSDWTSGFWSTDDVFYQNTAMLGTHNGANNGAGGALHLFMAQQRNCEIVNAKFVNNTADGDYGADGSGGAIYVYTRSAKGGPYAQDVIDKLDGCVFYGNQGMSTSKKLSATVWGADITVPSGKKDFNPITISNTKLQLVYNSYTTNLRLNNKGGNEGYATDPKVPTEPTVAADQGYTNPSDAEIGDKGQGVKVDCKAIVKRPEVDVLKPHADITTNDSDKPGVSSTYASYCAGNTEYWAKFQSIGGEGPFTFTYDVWKQKGHSTERIVAGAVAETLKKRVPIEKEIPNLEPIYNDKGEITGYEQKGTKKVKVEEFPDNVIIKGDKLFPSNKVEEGYLYTIIVKSMTDGDKNEYTYDCVDAYDKTRQYAQSTGAQIFFKPCVVTPGDLDWDDDGILNTVECADIAASNLTPTVDKSGLGESKWIRYRDNVKTQQLFANIVKDENYLNPTPKTGRVLTLLPSVIGAKAATGDEAYTVDLSDKFGYEAGTGKVVVTVQNYSVDRDRFRTNNDRTVTTWEIGGTMHPYVLMQSTPVSSFHQDNQFGINVLTNEHALSQTELYTKMDDDRYTVYENQGTKKVLINNQDVNLTNDVALSYLNTEPGKKYFAFTQTPDQTGMVNTVVTIMLPCDDDMDGIPNFFDADSDGDGCPDAVEGDNKDITEDMVEDGVIKGDVDENGVPKAAKGGQGAGSAYDADVNACGNNYWTGDKDNDFNKKENWTNNVPKDGQDIIFADGSEDAKGKVAVRDLHLPAGKFISANKLVNNAPDKKIEEGATEKTPGHPAVVVPADGGLTVKSVEGFGTDADKDKLVMKTSTDGKKVGTFILNNENACTTKVFASVEFKPLGKYRPDHKATDNKDKTSPDFGKDLYAEFDWQYIGIPVKEVKKSPVFKGAKVRLYDEKKNDPKHYYQKWIEVTPTDNMTAFKGYEIAPVLDGSNGVRQIQGELNFCNQEIALTRQAAVVSASKAEGDDNAKRYGLGYNIVGNSFMAGVDINKIKLESGETGVDMDNTVYIYTTGSWDEWKNQNGQSVKVKGGYEAVNIGKAGESGITSTLSPMQGFMVKYNNPKYSEKTGTLTIPYTGLKSEAEPLRAKSFVMDGDFNRGSVMVAMDNGKVVDKFWTYQEEDATPAYDSQLEGEKLNMGEPSVFATTTDGKNVQISSLPSLIGSTFSVETAKDETYNMELNTWSLNYQNLKLVDLKTKTVIPFDNGKARYFFTATVDGIEHNRFMFADTPETDFEKVMGAVTGIDNVSITLTKGEAELFNLSGAKIGTFSLPLDAKKLKGQVPAGVYLIKATDGTNVQTSKIVIE